MGAGFLGTDIASSNTYRPQVAMEPSSNPFWQELYAFNDGSSLEDCPFPYQSDDAHFWYDSEVT